MAIGPVPRRNETSGWPAPVPSVSFRFFRASVLPCFRASVVNAWVGVASMQADGRGQTGSEVAE